MITEQELQEKFEQIDEKCEAKEKEIKSSQKYKDLEKERKNLEKEIEKLEDQQSEIKEEIRCKYTDDGKEPIYSSSRYYGKNIRWEVLNSIKRGLEIKNISLLKGSDIEEITRKLIDSDIKNNEEYQEKRDKCYKKQEIIDKIEDEQNKLLEETAPLYNERSRINKELWNFKTREKKRKKLGDKKETARLKRWDMKEKAEKKLKQNFNQIIEEVKKNVVKEKVMNELEEQNEDDYRF